MLKTLALALTLTGSVASAATFDLAGGFGAAPFSYGQVNANGTLTAFTPGGAGACSGNPNCNQGVGNFYQLVALSTPNVLYHPGDDAGENSAIRFTPALGGVFKFTGSAFLNSNGGSGNGTDIFFHQSGNPGVFNLAASTVTPNAIESLSSTFTLGAGESFDIVIGNRGEYQYDSTFLSGSFAAVPEPAQWGLLIGGFALVGGAARRRRVAALA